MAKKNAVTIKSLLEEINGKIVKTESEISEIESIKSDKLSAGESLDEDVTSFDVTPYMNETTDVKEEIEV